MIKDFEYIKKQVENMNTLEICEEHGSCRCLVVWDRTAEGANCPVCDLFEQYQADIDQADYNECESLELKEQAEKRETAAMVDKVKSENRAIDAKRAQALAEDREAAATKRLLKQAEQISELEAMLNEFKEIYEYGSYHSCSNDLCENYQTYKEKYKND
jgi:hypothetical protein